MRLQRSARSAWIAEFNPHQHTLKNTPFLMRLSDVLLSPFFLLTFRSARVGQRGSGGAGLIYARSNYDFFARLYWEIGRPAPAALLPPTTPRYPPTSPRPNLPALPFLNSSRSFLWRRFSWWGLDLKKLSGASCYIFLISNIFLICDFCGFIKILFWWTLTYFLKPVYTSNPIKKIRKPVTIQF